MHQWLQAVLLLHFYRYRIGTSLHCMHLMSPVLHLGLLHHTLQCLPAIDGNAWLHIDLHQMLLSCTCTAATTFVTWPTDMCPEQLGGLPLCLQPFYGRALQVAFGKRTALWTVNKPHSNWPQTQPQSACHAHVLSRQMLACTVLILRGFAPHSVWRHTWEPWLRASITDDSAQETADIHCIARFTHVAWDSKHAVTAMGADMLEDNTLSMKVKNVTIGADVAV